MENQEIFHDMMIPGNTVMVLHGPGIIDSGNAALLARLIRPARIIVSGVMARTAAEESGLPVEYSGIPPSMTMKDLDTQCFLANQGKTPLSGRVFGEIVSSRLAPKGLVHLETADRRIYLWNKGNETLAETLRALTGFALVRHTSCINRSDEVREIRGCIPGEAVFVEWDSDRYRHRRDRTDRQYRWPYRAAFRPDTKSPWPGETGVRSYRCCMV